MPTSRERRRRLLEAARLYFVCEGRPAGRSPIPLLDAALRGGAGIIQLREKSHRSADELIALAGPFSRTAARFLYQLYRLNWPGRGDVISVLAQPR